MDKHYKHFWTVFYVIEIIRVYYSGQYETVTNVKWATVYVKHNIADNGICYNVRHSL